MAVEMKSKSNYCSVIPFLMGGLVGGAAVAMVFAPQLAKARDAVCNAATKAKQLMSRKKMEQGKSAESQEADISCAVPEGADICYDEKGRT